LVAVADVAVEVVVAGGTESLHGAYRIAVVAAADGEIEIVQGEPVDLWKLKRMMN